MKKSKERESFQKEIESSLSAELAKLNEYRDMCGLKSVSHQQYRDRHAFKNVVGYMNRRGHKTAKEYVKQPPGKIPSIKAKKIGRLLAHDVILVDGEAVRSVFDIDFVAGGNHARYGFVPPGSVWIERTIERKFIAPVIVHEIVELVFMRMGGLSYSKAHDEANAVEKQMRAIMKAGKFLGKNPVAMALEFLESMK